MELPSLDHPAGMDGRLIALRAAGFQFTTNRDDAGRIAALVGVRAHQGVIDIIQLYSETAADAARIPATEPEILFPRTVLWRTTGPATQVIDELLILPPP